jgi:hypothetical protein
MTLAQRSMATLFKELIDGPPPEAAYMLNPGDTGLLRSLASMSAGAASRVPMSGGATIAAHVDHIVYGLALLNEWHRGNPDPWSSADWSASWSRTVVDDNAWAALRASLEHETRAWLEAIQAPREYTQTDLNNVMSSIAHLAYHLGAIRQIDRALCGPSATPHTAGG